MTEETKKIDVSAFGDIIDHKRISEMVTQKLHEDISNSVIWQARDIATKEVIKQLEPDIAAIVTESKQMVLDAVTEAMPKVAALLAERIVVNATDRLNGYSGKDIIASIFKS